MACFVTKGMVKKMIPKVIHYCWFGGKPLPDDVKKYIATWEKYCPDYAIKQWNENNFDVTENQYCQEAYKAKKWAFVSDYARLKVLYKYGGIYMDTDVEVVKNLDPLLQYRAFSGFESDRAIPTGTMGSVKGNEWIKVLLQDYEERRFLKSDGSYDLTTNVVRITEITKKEYGIHLNNTLQYFGDQMVLFPFDYLCAKSFEIGEIIQTNHTFTIHHFTGSWLSIEERRYLEIVQNYEAKWPEFFQYPAGKCFIKTLAAFRAGGLTLLKSKLSHMTK